MLMYIYFRELDDLTSGWFTWYDGPDEQLKKFTQHSSIKAELDLSFSPLYSIHIFSLSCVDYLSLACLL